MSANSDDGDSSAEVANSSSKEKKNTKKAPKNKSQDENEPKELPKKRVTVKLKRLVGYDLADQDDKTNGKIPLLDQNPIIEGSRNRKTISQVSTKGVPVTKRGSRAVEIPNGRGKALGRITSTCSRIKALDDLMIKTLHRGLFGKGFGKTNDLLNNIMQFRGFEFQKDSEAYNEKLIDLSKKFNLQEMKILIYSFDLEMNYKTKEEAVTCILDFLIDPQPSKNPKPVLEGHPKRKATKRDYFEADLSREITKKRKKKPAAKESEEDSSAKKSTKKSKNNAEADEGAKDGSEKRDDEIANEEDNESKKPAKKRKSNQVIDEEGEKESLQNGDSQPTKAKKKKGGKK